MRDSELYEVGMSRRYFKAYTRRMQGFNMTEELYHEYCKLKTIAEGVPGGRFTWSRLMRDSLMHMLLHWKNGEYAGGCVQDVVEGKVEDDPL